jgi:hypothetical protein
VKGTGAGKLPILYILERNPQAENGLFAAYALPVENQAAPQVIPYEGVTTKLFEPDFFLT